SPAIPQTDREDNRSCVRDCTGGRWPVASESRKTIEERPRLLQVRGVEPFGEPAVDLGQQRPGFGRAALLPVEAAETQGGPQLQGFGALPAGQVEGSTETPFRRAPRGRTPFALREKQLPPEAVQLGLQETFARGGGQGQGLVKGGETLLRLAFPG